MSGLQWERVPADLRDPISVTFGPITKAEDVDVGEGPGRRRDRPGGDVDAVSRLHGGVRPG
nr:hypothetical protein [Microbispora rosea]